MHVCQTTGPVGPRAAERGGSLTGSNHVWPRLPAPCTGVGNRVGVNRQARSARIAACPSVGGARTQSRGACQGLAPNARARCARGPHAPSPGAAIDHRARRAGSSRPQTRPKPSAQSAPVRARRRPVCASRQARGPQLRRRRAPIRAAHRGSCREKGEGRGRCLCTPPARARATLRDRVIERSARCGKMSGSRACAEARARGVRGAREGPALAALVRQV